MTARGKTWIEISRTALLRNFESIKSLVAPSHVTCVVKADAYGHGLEPVSRVLSEAGATHFAVDSLEEGERLRVLVGSRATILVLGYVPSSELARLIRHDLSFVLFNEETLTALEPLMRSEEGRARLHIPVETGLHREGFAPDELRAILERISRLRASYPDRIVLEGVQTHFADVEDTNESSYAEKQLSRFEELVKAIESAGFRDFKKHTASSAASILYSKSRFDMVRPGIALYGLWPSDTTRERSWAQDMKLALNPVLTWKTMIAQVKNVPSGQPIGYGLTEVAKKNLRIAVLPIGYYDGFDRGLSGKGQVCIRGNRCKVMGRVCMDMIMVDVTHLPEAKPEDEVVLIGTQGEASVSADQMAELVGSINYEIVARLSREIPKIVV